MIHIKNKIDENFIPNESCLIVSMNKIYAITAYTIDLLIKKNLRDISAVVLKGGDINPDLVNQIAYYIRHEFPKLKIAWFSDEDYLDSYIKLSNFDYIKLGSLDTELGDYHHEGSNQKVYKVRKVRGGKLRLADITEKFYE